MDLKSYYCPDPNEKPLDNLVEDGGFAKIFRRIAYVGDSNTDILFAKAVGMLPVATPWGYRSREELVEAGATLIAETPADLPTLL